MVFLRPFLTRSTAFLEVGVGDCSLSLAVAPLVKHVHALDVSPTITLGEAWPSNFELVLSDGIGIPMPEGSVDLAYSNQLMEHLYPEDVLEQPRGLLRALAPGGK